MKTNIFRFPLPLDKSQEKPSGPKVTKMETQLFQALSNLQPSTFSTDYLLLPEVASSSPTRRLLVVIPVGDFDESEFARRIYALARPKLFAVHFMALVSGPEVDMYLRRRMAILVSLVQDGLVTVSSQLAYQPSWFEAIKTVTKEGDLVVCLGSHRLPGLLNHRYVAQQIASRQAVPVYVMNSVTYQETPEMWKQPRVWYGWLISIFILVVFFILQVYLDRTLPDPISEVLQILSLLLEVYLIYKSAS